MPDPALAPEQEVRFAVVMYGGVSLAIYINGVTQELYNLVRATAPARQNEALRWDQLPENGTERVYRKLSHLLADKAKTLTQAKEDAETDKPVRTRFVIDILSGSSAGGINAIYLAKALANGQAVGDLKKLWKQEGDLKLLLNDEETYRVREAALAPQSPPESLLNSRRMYLKLLTALDQMEGADGARDPGRGTAAYVDELDVFITATDLRGIRVPLRLADGVVEERRHKYVFHFRYPREGNGPDERNDFHKDNNPFLAFAARCTSAFPFAFEPMTLGDVKDVLATVRGFKNAAEYEPGSKRCEMFLARCVAEGAGADGLAGRYYGDGGDLDNKPFSYATEALLRRQVDVPVVRKLIYIEPAPERLKQDPAGVPRPDALENLLLAGLTLPRYETIREDLQRVREHNELVERVNRILGGLEKDVDLVKQDRRSSAQPFTDEQWAGLKPKDRGRLAKSQPWRLWPQHWDELVAGWDAPRLKELFAVAEHHPESLYPAEGAEDKRWWARIDEEWCELDLVDMVKMHGQSYVAYHRLKIGATTDDLASLLASAVGVEEQTDRYLALRCLVHAWRDQAYDAHRTAEGRPALNKFLFDFAFGYRLRRFRFVRGKADLLARWDEAKARAVAPKLGVPGDDAARLALKPFQDELAGLRDVVHRCYTELRGLGRQLEDQNGRLATEYEALLEVVRGLGPPPAPGARKPDDKDLLNRFLDAFLTGQAAPPAAGQPPPPPQPNAEEAVLANASAFLADAASAPVRTAFTALADELAKTLREKMAKLDDACRAALTTPHPDPSVRAARRCLWHFFFNYDDYDMVAFPILYGTNIGEAATVEVSRISPEDATSLIDERADAKGRRKLAGTRLYAFSGFLSQLWRHNDILWGRLDGAERLLSILLPGDTKEVQEAREALIREAHGCILREELAAADPAMVEQFASAARGGFSGDPQRVLTLLKDPGNDQLRQNVLPALLASLPEDVLLKCFKENYEADPNLNPKELLLLVSRSTQVIGHLFEGLADRNGQDGSQLRWIARFGSFFWGLVEVAVPGGFWNLISRHWLVVFYLAAILLLVVGVILPGAASAGVVVLAATVLLHLVVAILGDYMRRRRKAWSIALVVLIVVVGFLAVLGAFDVITFLKREQTTWEWAVELYHWLQSFWMRPAPGG